ncbi:MAG: hypothetical protein WC749_17285, partial [Dehalococcoidia bacterium]
TRNPGAFAWIPAFAGKTNGDSFLPGVFRRAESGTQNDTNSLLYGQPVLSFGVGWLSPDESSGKQ